MPPTHKPPHNHQFNRISSIRLISIACALCPVIATAGTPDYTEERIDITEYISQIYRTATAGSDTDDSLQAARQTILDFTQCGNDGTRTYTMADYGDSIRTRSDGAETRWFADSADTRTLKGIFSRSFTLKFHNGPVFTSTSSSLKTKSDTLTIVHADGSYRSFPISTFYSRQPGGTVIPAEGDTIRETIKYITGYSFPVPDNNGGFTVATYTNTRWETDNREHSILEWEQYTGWNGDTRSATLTASRSPNRKPRVKDNKNPAYHHPELIRLTITDLSGKIQRQYTPEEASSAIDYGLPPGWYIITEEYTDKNISTKTYLNSR